VDSLILFYSTLLTKFKCKNRGRYLIYVFSNDTNIDGSIRYKYAKVILSNFLSHKYPPSVILKCLNLFKNNEVGIKVLSYILSKSDLFKLPYNLVSTAIYILKNLEKAEFKHYFISVYPTKRSEVGLFYYSKTPLLQASI
jgi:hypothetical protein